MTISRWTDEVINKFKMDVITLLCTRYSAHMGDSLTTAISKVHSGLPKDLQYAESNILYGKAFKDIRTEILNKARSEGVRMENITKARSELRAVTHSVASMPVIVEEPAGIVETPAISDVQHNNDSLVESFDVVMNERIDVFITEYKSRLKKLIKAKMDEAYFDVTSEVMKEVHFSN